MELIDLIPNSMTFRVVTTHDIVDESEIPEGFTGRVRRHIGEYVAYVAWYRHGVLHNPGRSHPAFQRFRPDGRLKFEMYYTEGELHDPDAATPAVRGWFDNGAVHYEERYQFGRRQDSPDGVAAIRKFRADGTLRHELHYHQGVRLSETRFGDQAGDAAGARI